MRRHYAGSEEQDEAVRQLTVVGQRDPKNEYKKEGFAMFMDMVNRIKSDTLERLFRVQVVRQEAAMEAETRRRPQRITLNRGDGEEARKPAKAENKAGRNDPCPCGSGKKYKKCHGVSEAAL